MEDTGTGSFAPCSASICLEAFWPTGSEDGPIGLRSTTDPARVIWATREEIDTFTEAWAAARAAQ